MRTIGAGLLAHYQSGNTALAWGLKITRADAQVFGFTSHQRDVVISGTTYLAGPGLDVSSLAMSAGFGVDNAELTILADDTTFTVESLLSGRWDGAAFEVFRFNWADLTQGRDVIMRGNLGNVTPRAGAFVVELRGLQQYLQQPVGAPSTKTCRARLGDALCTKNLAAFTHTGTVTAVTSAQVFEDSSRTEADDYFGEGILTWLTGDNAGLSVKVKTYSSATDTFTLLLPMVLPIQVGDTYSAVAGCRKRLQEDCRDKFSNVLNFQGEPHRPVVDEITAYPEPNAE
jgi:uncharacterized phage protein (TIGR02218 family)